MPIPEQSPADRLNKMIDTYKLLEPFERYSLFKTDHSEEDTCSIASALQIPTEVLNKLIQ